MADKRVRKPDDLEARIAALREELVVSKRQEHDDQQAELLRILDRTGSLADALAWARKRVKRKPAGAKQADEASAASELGGDGAQA